MRGRIFVYGSSEPFELPKSTTAATLELPGVVVGTVAWNPKEGTWMLTANTPTHLSGREIGIGMAEKLRHLDVIETAGCKGRFVRIPDNPEVDGQPAPEIRLKKRSAIIGRKHSGSAALAPEGGIRIDLDGEDRHISRNHALIEWDGSDFTLTDTSSSGTLLNGKSPPPQSKLIYGDRFVIGAYLFEYAGDSIRVLDQGAAGEIKARAISIKVKSGKVILNKVSLDIGSGEFIGIVGGSGSGKSTLMNALCGIMPATSGKVEIGGVAIDGSGDMSELSVGLVPQDDIVHTELTVRDAVTYSASLRLRLSRHQTKKLVDGTLERLGLTEHESKPIKVLSGGQRKRVSIATELLAKPVILFLDEPSSGLDPAMEGELMSQLDNLRRLGLTLICTTHVLERAFMFSKLCFIHAGRLIFLGDVREARSHFFDYGAASVSATNMRGADAPLVRIYDKLLHDRRTPEEWEQKFRETHPVGSDDAPSPPHTKQKRRKVGYLRSLFVLLSRQWSVLKADKLNVLFLLAQAIFIGSLVGWVSDDQGFRLFLCQLATLWFGCSNAGQQIVGEMPIFRRERICGVGIHPYVQSKFVFLGMLTSMQAMLLLVSMMVSTAFFNPVQLYDVADSELEAGLKDPEGNFETLSQREARKFTEEFSSRDDQVLAFQSQLSEALARAEGGASARVDKSVVAFRKEQLKGEAPLYLFLARYFGMRYNFLNTGHAPTLAGKETLMVKLIGRLNHHEVATSDEAKNALIGQVKTIAALEGISGASAASMLASFPESALFKLTDDETGRPLLREGVSPRQVALTAVGFRLLSLLLSGIVGVAMGLTISALVRNEVQAVLWVPLILIPQILFGGYVIPLPEMPSTVRVFSRFVPSHASEQVMETSLLYGQATPEMTNRTKVAAFLTPNAEQETISWVRGTDEVEQSFYKISPHNIAWQNNAIIHEWAGQHKAAEPTDEYGDEIRAEVLQAIESADSIDPQLEGLITELASYDPEHEPPMRVPERNDVIFKHGNIFNSPGRALEALMILSIWMGACYVVIWITLRIKQSGGR